MYTRQLVLTAPSTRLMYMTERHSDTSGYRSSIRSSKRWSKNRIAAQAAKTFVYNRNLHTHAMKGIDILVSIFSQNKDTIYLIQFNEVNNLIPR